MMAENGAERIPLYIRATVDLAEEVVPSSDLCAQLFKSIIEGSATPLGAFSGVGSTCVHSPPEPIDAPPFPAPGPPPYTTAGFSNPRWVLTFAVGDELWMEAVDAVAVFSQVDGSLRARGTHRIIGGTGRFTGAAGELQSEATNAGDGPDDFESRGWISMGAG